MISSTFNPERKIYGQEKRVHADLESSRTDSLRESIWNAVKTPCDFSFKRCYISTSGKSNYYLKIEGFCREKRCGVELLGFCKKEPPQNADVVIHLSTYKTDHVPHYSKGQVKGVTREKIGDELRHMKAAAYVDWQSDKLMVFGNINPPIISSEGVCRRIEQEVEKEEWNYGSGRDLLKYISGLIVSSDGVIRDFSANPLSIVYWTEEQEIVWKSLNNNGKILSLKLDASGCKIGTVEMYETESRHILLYTGVVNCDHKEIPSTQMVSARQDADIIGHRWLKPWLSSVDIVPTIIVTDQSAALQNGASVACNGMSYEESLDRYFKFRINTDNRLPPCWLRIDIAHLTNAVSEWDCLKNVNYLTKDTIKKSVGYMSSLSQVQDLESFLRDVITVVKCPTRDAHVGETIRLVLQVLSTYKLPQSQISPEQDEEMDGAANILLASNGVDNDGSNGVSSIDIFIDGIIQEATDRPCSTGARRNPYYCPRSVKNLRLLCQKAPGWTNIMRVLLSEDS
ncbi:hypothetical protein QAD02_003083 [Eretmocerus hayati]|uniref:Uncharacterized protein n=1 Tax=Eretmocerus hayati TaxID=131215 RepID=A0ACC2NND3_9HYME|nr:hypothetical protein QAD02_003083 [Eretmocerus hayati]